jgi:dihydrofolate reductase
MGRKTFESIGRVLPERTNIIVSRLGDRANDKNLLVQGDENLIWASGREAALFAADIFSIIRGREDFFIIGGEEIFEVFDPLVNRVYLTLVFGDIVGDAKFDKQFPSKVWRTKEEIDIPAGEYDEYPSRFIVYERRERRYRQRYLSSFYTEQPAKERWLEKILAENASKIRAYAEHHVGEQQELFESENVGNPEERKALMRESKAREGASGRTDWARVNALTDEEIERMAEADIDNPITEEKDWANASVALSPRKTQ